MEIGQNTHLAGSLAGGPGRTGGGAPHLVKVQAVLDLLRAPGARLRILDASDSASHLPGARDDVVARFPLRADGGPRFLLDAFDCATSIDLLHRVEPDRRRDLLVRLRRATRGAVVIEMPQASNGHNPLAEAIDVFHEFGDSVMVLGDEHLPALFALRELERPGSADRNGASSGNGNGNGNGNGSAGAMLGAAAGEARSVLVSIVDPAHAGIELSLLEWCCSPGGAGSDAAGLAVLPLSLEVRRLSGRLEIERARADRSEAEGADLRRKLADLTRIASEDRAAREQADRLVEIVAAARGYRIGLALYNARRAARRCLGSIGRGLSAPWRAIARRGSRGPADAS